MEKAKCKSANSITEIIYLNIQVQIFIILCGRVGKCHRGRQKYNNVVLIL